MVATPAGSTAYNLSAYGPILPLDAPLLALTPVSPFRPRRWRGALLSHKVTVRFDVLEPGKRPVNGATETFQNDPHWRDLIYFYEYFHADNGAGLGASHQTGWTGIIARIMHLFATNTDQQFVGLGRDGAIYVDVPPRTAGKPKADSEPRPAQAR